MQTGGCLCGSVRYEVSKPLTSVTYCHCSMCRRWHGHVGAYTAVDHDGFRLSEERGLAWHASSDKARRGFCRECGSSVLFEEKGDPRWASALAASTSHRRPREGAHLHSQQGRYYEIADGLLKYEVFR